MTSCTSCPSASPTPIHRVVLVASLAVLAAGALIAWQPSVQAPTVAIGSTAPAAAMTVLAMQAGGTGVGAFRPMPIASVLQRLIDAARG